MTEKLPKDRRIRRWYRGVAQSVIGAGLWALLTYILGLLFSSGVAAFFATKLTHNLVGYQRVSVVALLTLGAAFLFSLIFSRIQRHKPALPRLDPDLIILRKEVENKYVARDRIEYRRKLRVRALKDNVSRFPDKYIWTGDVCSFRSGIEAHSVERTRRRNIWQHYEVLLDRPLMKGQEVEMEVVWDLEDPHGRAVPFVSATVEDPTQELVLTVIFLREWNIQSVNCEISLGIGAHKALDSFTLDVEQGGAVRWHLEPPRLLHHYEMRWSFSGGVMQ